MRSSDGASSRPRIRRFVTFDESSAKASSSRRTASVAAHPHYRSDGVGGFDPWMIQAAEDERNRGEGERGGWGGGRAKEKCGRGKRSRIRKASDDGWISPVDKMDKSAAASSSWATAATAARSAKHQPSSSAEIDTRLDDINRYALQ